MNRILKVFYKISLAIICLPVAFVLYHYIPHIIPNQLALRELRMNLDRLEVPPGAAKNAGYGYVGKYSGIGTYCDIVASSLFETDQNIYSVRDFYEYKAVRAPSAHRMSLKIILGYYDGKALKLPGDDSRDFEKEDHLELFADKLPADECRADKFCYMTIVVYTTGRTLDYRCYGN